MRRLHCLTWSSSSSWNYGLRTKKGMFPECFVASLQSRGLPSSAPPCRSCIFCYSERYFAAQLSGRRACQCPVHRPTTTRRTYFVVDSKSNGTQNIIWFYFRLSWSIWDLSRHLLPWEDMIKSAATFATLIRPTTSQRKVNWGPLKDPSSQAKMEQTWKLWWWVLHKIKSESRSFFRPL